MTSNFRTSFDAPTSRSGVPLRELAYYLASLMGAGLRLPVYMGQRSGGQAYLGGGRVAILTDSSMPCAMLYMVCPTDVAPSIWDFSLLRGCEVVVYYRPQHRDYALGLYVQLKSAGVRLIALSCRKGTQDE